METSGQKSVTGGKVQFKSEAIMRDVCAGPYHCCTVAMSNDLYSWGLDRMGSTGLPIKKEQYNKRKNRLVKDPRVAVLLSKELEDNKEKNRLLNENDDEVYENRIQTTVREEIKITESDQVGEEEEKKAVNENIDRKQVYKQPGSVKPRKEIESKIKENEEKKNRKAVFIERPVSNEDIQVIHKFVKTSKFRLVAISKGNKFNGLHKYLVDEKVNKCDEMNIIRLNKRLYKYLDQILNTVRTSITIHQYRTMQEFKLESSFISRISVKPFNLNSIVAS